MKQRGDAWYQALSGDYGTRISDFFKKRILSERGAREADEEAHKVLCDRIKQPSTSICEKLAHALLVTAEGRLAQAD